MSRGAAQHCDSSDAQAVPSIVPPNWDAVGRDGRNGPSCPATHQVPPPWGQVLLLLWQPRFLCFALQHRMHAVCQLRPGWYPRMCRMETHPFPHHFPALGTYRAGRGQTLPLTTLLLQDPEPQRRATYGMLRQVMGWQHGASCRGNSRELQPWGGTEG